MQKHIDQYINIWESRGYPNGLPDEVPDQLMHERLAPSFKAIALTILRNDHGCQSLGFTPDASPWYSAIKRNEIAARSQKEEVMEEVSIASGRSGDIAKFWTHLGPLIASRQVAKVVREPVFDDEATIWFIAQNKEGATQGFCAAHLGHATAILRYHWVIQDKNGEQVMQSLCETRHKYLSHDHGALRQSIATRSRAIIEQLKSYGFIQSGKKGQIVILHSTVVRQPKIERTGKKKPARAIYGYRTARKTFHPVPKPVKAKHK